MSVTAATPVRLIQPPEGVQPESPEWWVYELDRELDARFPLVGLYEDYYEGRHKLNFATSTYREQYAKMLAAVSDNWIPLIIQAAVERLRPQGFLFGEDQKGDKEAWDIWQRNYLDADAPLGFTEASKHAESYLLIWPDDAPSPGVFGRFFSRSSEKQVPRITVEHPGQMVVRRAAGDRRRRVAALKRWQENDGSHMATLYLPDEIHRFQRAEGRWRPREGVEASDKNPLGLVPVVPLVNEPHMLPCRPPNALIVPPHNVPASAAIGLGRSDQADVISTIDQIDKLVCDMMVASEFAAFKQRWATGLEVEVDPETGRPKEGFEAAVDRIWAVADDKAKFGEFSATELKNYTGAIENRVQSLAARTRTPPHYLLGSIVNVSGDALKSAETGLSSKCDGKKDSFGEGLEEAIRIAFAWMDDDRAKAFDAKIDWAPSEARSESEFVDSLVKKLAIGVPKEQLWRDYGYSPQEIERFKKLLRDEAAEAGVLDRFKVPDPTDPETPPPEPEPEPVAGE